AQTRVVHVHAAPPPQLNVRSQHSPSRAPPRQVPRCGSLPHAGCAAHVPPGQSQSKPSSSPPLQTPSTPSDRSMPPRQSLHQLSANVHGRPVALSPLRCWSAAPDTVIVPPTAPAGTALPSGVLAPISLDRSAYVPG